MIMALIDLTVVTVSSIARISHFVQFDHVCREICLCRDSRFYIANARIGNGRGNALVISRYGAARAVAPWFNTMWRTRYVRFHSCLKSFRFVREILLLCVLSINHSLKSVLLMLSRNNVDNWRRTKNEVSWIYIRL